MCHTRARARVAGWIRGGLRSGAGPNRAFDASLVRRTSGGMHRERALCMALCDPIRGIPKERPARCVACTRAEHSRAVRTRVHNDRITIRRVTLTRAVYVCTADRPAAPCVYFTPPRHRETDTASVREGGGRRAHADETRAPAMRFPNAAALMRQRPRIRRPELWLGSS